MPEPSQLATLEAGSWPLNCLSFYSHMARDWGRYVQSLSKCTDAMETARAEGDFGVRLFGDVMQAYYDLAMGPWTAVASAMAQQAANIPPAAAPFTTAKSGGRAAG